jgi:DNA-binding Lrp family transcriptional regulator
MLTISVDEETKKRVIQRRKEGVNMRNVAKKFHLSFTTIKKIWDEREGNTESKTEKSITSKAFSLFGQNMSLVKVTIELDLDPKEAEKIHESYLRLKGLDKIVKYCYTVEKHLASFSDFVYACEVHTPESQKILDIMNLIDLNTRLKNEKWRLMSVCSNERKKINELKLEEEAIKQRIENLKQEEVNKWYELFGNGRYYANNQNNEP